MHFNISGGKAAEIAVPRSYQKTAQQIPEAMGESKHKQLRGNKLNQYKIFRTKNLRSTFPQSIQQRHAKVFFSLMSNDFRMKDQ